MREAERDMRAVLRAHRAVFSGIGKAKVLSFTLSPRTTPTRCPSNMPTRRESLAEQTLEREEVERLVREGILEPSRAPAATRNVFVEKTTYDVNGRREMRTAKDFRRLNSITRSDAYPLEDIHAIV
jgi:hypothetical protein